MTNYTLPPCAQARLPHETASHLWPDAPTPRRIAHEARADYRYEVSAVSPEDYSGTRSKGSWHKGNGH
jgi:hypothetical protein